MMLDTREITKKISKYFTEDHIKNIITKAEYEESESLVIDFGDMNIYEPNLCEVLLQYPEEAMKVFNSVVKHLSKIIKRVRFKELPESEVITLNELRSEHIGKLVVINGLLKRKSDVLPKTKAINYLCTNPSCSFSEQILRVKQTEETIKLIKCCPRCKSPVEVTGQDEVDSQTIILEDDLENMKSTNSQPKIKQVLLETDLTTPLKDNTVSAGAKISVIGLVSKQTKLGKRGQLTVSNLIIHANNVIPLEETTFDLHISAEDEIKIKELSEKENLIELISTSIAPNVAGRNKIKEATCYYIVGGTKDENKRSNIHILNVGNASVGKSLMLTRLKKFLPGAVYISCENATSVGITGSVTKDEFTGQWTVEAGAMAYANKSHFLVDEFDKISKEDKTKMNEGLESGVISITKAGVNTQLKTDCPVYASGNPKDGRFNDTEKVKQINFDPTTLSRFDLIFIIDDRDEKEEGDEVIDKILGLNEDKNEYIDDDLLRKYFLFAKTFNPIIPIELSKEIKEYYQKIKQSSRDGDLTITYRQLDGIIRLCQARAKLFLRNEVTSQDLKAIQELMNYTLSRFGVAEIETGISNTYKSIRTNILDIMHRDEQSSLKNISFEITKQNKEIKPSKIEEILQDLKKETIIFEPSRGKYRVVD